MRVDAAKPCSARSSPAWLRDEPSTTPEPNKSPITFAGISAADAQAKFTYSVGTTNGANYLQIAYTG